MSLKISINGFKALRPIAKKTKCKVSIIKKKGLPFTLYKYKRRKTFVFGALLFLILINFLCSFIWSIDIEGNANIESQVIVDCLAELNVKPGVLKFGVDSERAVDHLMLRIKEFAWVGVTVKGTKVKVKVEERKLPPELIDKNEPCDIIALKDGVIKSMVTKAGMDMVKPGNTVVKGQVLISGSIPNKNDQNVVKLVHSIGSVKARTWYEKSCEVKTKVLERVRTGNHKDKYSITLFVKRFNLFNPDIKYGEYENIQIKKTVTLGQDMVLPFGLVIDRYYEINSSEREISLDEAKKSASEEAYKEASKGISEDAEIINSNMNIVQRPDGKLFANVIIECLEEIGIQKKIGGK